MRRWGRKWKKRSRRGKETNPYKILLVEDDAAISEMLKNYLETENYELACARDAAHPGKKLRADHYSIGEGFGER